MAAELSPRKSRKCSFSRRELDILVSCVLENYDVLYGEMYNSYLSREIRSQAWKEILDQVNRVSQERRTLSEIKNKWKKYQSESKMTESSDGSIIYLNEEDSMPLQQRLSQNLKDIPSTSHSNISPLHSLPLSPTKLKVTRQGKSVGPPNPVPSSVPSQICLKWNSHHVNMQTAFPSLLTREQYVDATLVSEGKTLKCHRMILSSCSSYFEEILNGIMPFQHPVLFMKDIPFWALKALCDFMYAGEVHIGQEKLADLLAAANSLKIKGLATSIQKNTETEPAIPEIKREVNTTPPLRSLERVIKFEKDDSFFTGEKNELMRVMRRKDDRRYSPRSAPITKEKDKLNEYLKAPASNRAVAIGSKVTVRKLDKAIQKPLTTKNSYPLKKASETNRTNRQRLEDIPSKEKVKEVPLRKDNISDPLDLLQPVYEEIAKDIEPAGLVLAKLKDKQGCFSMRRNIAKRVKKRKHTEERESFPSQYLSRKGTRSRPNVKIPKFFDSHYEERAQQTTEATIVREPHTNHNDPLIEVAEIKAEPLDVEEAAIEMEENLDNYIDHDLEMVSQEGEEIIGNYDSPLVNFNGEPKASTPDMFKKIPQPLIINVHTVSESDERLLGKVKIVDIAQISNTTRGDEEIIIGDNNFEAIETVAQAETSQIVISNVQSMAEVIDDPLPIKENEDATPPDKEGENATDPLAAQESETEGSQGQGVSSLGSLETKIEMVHINSQDDIAIGCCENEENTLEGGSRESVTNSLEENRMDVVDLHQEVADSTSAAAKGRKEETTCETTEDHQNTNQLLSAENITGQFLETFESPSESLGPTENQENISHDNQQTLQGNFHIEEEVASTSADTTTCNNSATYKVQNFIKDEEFDHLNSSHFKLYNFASNDLSGFSRGLENIEEESAYIGLSEVTEEPDVLSGFEEEDVVMKEAADSRNMANYDSEQTLEKIVNDLNETLYDMGSK